MSTPYLRARSTITQDERNREAIAAAPSEERVDEDGRTWLVRHLPGPEGVPPASLPTRPRTRRRSGHRLG